MRNLVLVILLLAGSGALASDVQDELRDRVDANHYAYRPAGDGPYPAVVVLPGCSGIAATGTADRQGDSGLARHDRLFRQHLRNAAVRLQEAGYLVLLVDLQRAEGLSTACHGEISAARIAEYIDASVAYAGTFPFVDREQIHLVGWSLGGRGVLNWMHGPRASADSIRSAIAIYPGCENLPLPDLSTPLLVLLGGADDVSAPGPCARLLQQATSRNTRFVFYPDARHGFDIEAAPSRLEIGDNRTMGYDRASASAAWRAIRDFLERH